jgi:chromosome segregation ATPase
MGLRSKVKTMLSAPLGALLDAALRELVEASLDARGLVRQAEVDAITERVEGFRRELAERRTGLDALRQALDAWARDQEDELDASLEVGLDLADADARLTGLEEGYEDLKRRIERSAGAVEIARAQLEALHGRLAVVDERSAKAALVANAAQSAAEAAADGVAGLESTPQR